MRVVKDFVRDMFRKRRSPMHIRSVALCTYWSSKMDEVKYWIDRGIKTLEKKQGSKQKTKRLIIK